MKHQSSRFPVIDAFKAIASQLIVFHHLSVYGPLSDAAQQAIPQLVSWLYDDARMAVQVFLVIGGYLSARTLFPGGGRYSGSLVAAIVNRYVRLAVPYVAALAFSVTCAAIARQWMTDEFIPDAPTLSQSLAHVFLLQNLLEFDALSAGVWYIAIDFQLFVLMVGILWVGRRFGRGLTVSAQFLVAAMTIASLLWFNRHSGLDDWAPYFFGAYGMGAASYWASQRSRQDAAWFWLILGFAVVALLIDFRARIAIALSVAIMLWIAGQSSGIGRWSAKPLLLYLGRISYSLFLVHFPILMLTNGLFSHFGLSSAFAGMVGSIATWLVSLIAADCFYRWVEAPAARFKVNTMLNWLRPGMQRMFSPQQLPHFLSVGVLILAGATSLWGIIGTQTSAPWTYRRNLPVPATLVQYNG